MDLREIIPAEHHNIDPNQFKERSFGKLDIGNYRFLITGVEVENNGPYEAVKYAMEVVEGKGVGRKAWVRFTVKYSGTDDKSKMLNFNYTLLRELFAACGLTQLGDIGLLVGKTPVGYLYYRPDGNGVQRESYSWMNGPQPLVVDNKYRPAPEDVAAVKKDLAQVAQQSMTFAAPSQPTAAPAFGQQAGYQPVPQPAQEPAPFQSWTPQQ